MRFYLSTVLTVAAALVSAAPSPIRPRDISTNELSQFNFWVQYAAAAYCQPNYAGEASSKLSCVVGNCPAVEQAGASIFYSFSNSTPTDTAGYIAIDSTNQAIILAFRGSYSVRNWAADVTFTYEDPGLCPGCQAETGFWNSWALVRDHVVEQLDHAIAQHPGYELVIVGHSLGAAVATLAAADIRGREGGQPSASLYAFASPRVANTALAKYITAQNNNYRFTHTNDPVPQLPTLSMGYVHVSPEYWITAPDNATVRESEVEVLDGAVNWNGNTGTATVPDVPDVAEFDAHHWYFEEVDACLGPGIPFK
ncbi:mono and diacylglycerol lipase [Aspergillus pseudoustus]|uniref:feruloyl esterase n=1 Tax=Aspergillus pseudoustus TaxID=1810923 RepID=A0ABR4IZI5_9EURO